MAKLTFRRGSQTIRPLAWAERSLPDGRRLVVVLRSDGAVLRRFEDGRYTRIGVAGHLEDPRMWIEARRRRGHAAGMMPSSGRLPPPRERALPHYRRVGIDPARSSTDG